MSDNLFKKAERTQAKLKLALTGVSGSGKTYSALLLASGIANKIAVIDTERGSASLYSDLINFDVMELEPPHSPQRYIQAIDAAIKAGYELLIIDSLSHAWAGEGGVLELVDNLTNASNSKNAYTNGWSKGTKEQNHLINKILGAPIHIICTLRSKTAYELVEGYNGKKAPQKVGLAPIQREGVDYEFTLVMDIDRKEHLVSVSKDRTGKFIDRIPFVVTPDIGKEIKDWLLSGKEIPIKVVEAHKKALYSPINPDPNVNLPFKSEPLIEELSSPRKDLPQGNLITDKQRKLIFALFNKQGIPDNEQRSYLEGIVEHPIESTKNLTKSEASQIIEKLQNFGTPKKEDPLADLIEERNE